MKGIYGNIERPMYLANGSIDLEVTENDQKGIAPAFQAGGKQALACRDSF